MAGPYLSCSLLCPQSLVQGQGCNKYSHRCWNIWMYLAITKVQSKSYINLSLSNFYGSKCCLLKMMYKAYKLTNPYEHLYNNEMKRMNHVNQEWVLILGILDWKVCESPEIFFFKCIFQKVYSYVCTFFLRESNVGKRRKCYYRMVV